MGDPPQTFPIGGVKHLRESGDTLGHLLDKHIHDISQVGIGRQA